MNQFKAATSLGFALMFVAGIAVGRVRWGVPPAPPAEHSWLAEQLDLSPAQREQVRRIWSDQMKASPDPAERWQAIEKQKDDAIRSLLTDAQRPPFDQVIREHEQRVADFQEQARASVRQAEERTRQVLEPPQRQKFDEIVTKHAHHGPSAMGPFKPGGGSGGGACPPGEGTTPSGAPGAPPHREPTTLPAAFSG